MPKLFNRASCKVAMVLLLGLMLSACAPKVERQFKQGCKDAGGNRAFCSCLYNKLASHYGPEMMSKAEDMRQLPADFNERGLEYTFSCRSKL